MIVYVCTACDAAGVRLVGITGGDSGVVQKVGPYSYLKVGNIARVPLVKAVPWYLVVVPVE